jgi:hypothetical protein
MYNNGMSKEERLAEDTQRDVAGEIEPDCRPRHERVSIRGEKRSPAEQKNVVDDAIPPEIFGCEAVAVEVELREVPFTD